MLYTKQLPRLDTLRQLCGQIKDFPITGLGIAQYAELLGYDDETVEFIKLISQRMVFNSRADFLEHCWLLEKLLKEERVSVPEYLRSPQG